MIRTAEESDAEKFLEIYSYYIKNTAITFEWDVPSTAEFAARIRKISEKYPFLVAERSGKTVGYAYAGTFNERRSCDWTVETSIYVAKDCRGGGVGRELYTALEKALAMQNIISLNACVAYPEKEDEYLTANSVRYHEHMGYRYVGEFHKCGYKFGRWYSLVWLEKFISEHPQTPPNVKWFPEIRDEFERTIAKKR